MSAMASGFTIVPVLVHHPFCTQDCANGKDVLTGQQLLPS
jgi:hypothetical protein